MMHKGSQVPQKLFDVWNNDLDCRERALEGRLEEDLRPVRGFIDPSADKVGEPVCELSSGKFANHNELRLDIADANECIRTSATTQDEHAHACLQSTGRQLTMLQGAVVDLEQVVESRRQCWYLQGATAGSGGGPRGSNNIQG